MFDATGGGADPLPDRQRVLDELRRRIGAVGASADGRRSAESVSLVPAPAPAADVSLAVALPPAVTFAPTVTPAPAAPAVTAAGPVPAPVRPAGVFGVPAALAPVLPYGGLPRGGVVSVAGAHGGRSLLLALLAASPGSWSALVGMPDIGLLAASEFGVDLDRVVLIPDPGPDLLQVLSVLVDGVDLVVVRPPPGGLPGPARLRVLTGRLRQRGAVLLVAGSWPGADLVLHTRITAWSGVGQGHGRLRDRELSVRVGGRGAAAGSPRAVTLLLRSSRTGVELLPAASPAARPIPVDRPVAVGMG